MAGELERDFSNYRVGDNVYELAGGLLPEMAGALGYELGSEPTEAALQGFVEHIGPAKWLQDNIAIVQERLASAGDAVRIAADWVDRSGALQAVNRSFVKPELNTPDKVDAAFITGGVARWMLRRANRLVETAAESTKVSKVYLPVGSRAMKASEHELIGYMQGAKGRAPIESEFADVYIKPLLEYVGLHVELLPVDTNDGDAIMDRFVAESDVTSGTVLAVGNAPSAIQPAGALRWAARKRGDFDSSGEQLFMLNDTIQVARNGEGPATHQNPFAALGQLARNALYLQRNS